MILRRIGRQDVVRCDQNKKKPRTPSPPSSMEVETLCFGSVSLPRVQDDSTASRGLWMGPCNVEYLGLNLIPSFPPIENATLRIWRRSAKRSGPKSLLRCMNLVTNYKKSLTSDRKSVV